MTALESPYSSRLPVALRVSKLPPACPATHASKQRAFRAGRRGCLQGPGARLTETEKMTELVGTDVGARGDARGLVAHEAACTPQIAVAVWTRVVRRDGRIFVDVAHHAYEAIADRAFPVGAARRARRLWLVVEDGVYLRLADCIDLVPGGVAIGMGARCQGGMEGAIWRQGVISGDAWRQGVMAGATCALAALAKAKPLQKQFC